jgi:hypothetical protein
MNYIQQVRDMIFNVSLKQDKYYDILSKCDINAIDQAVNVICNVVDVHQLFEKLNKLDINVIEDKEDKQKKKVSKYSKKARSLKVMCSYKDIYAPLNQSLHNKGKCDVVTLLGNEYPILFYLHDSRYKKLNIMIDNDINRASKLLSNIKEDGMLIIIFDIHDDVNLLINMAKFFSSFEVYMGRDEYSYTLYIVLNGYSLSLKKEDIQVQLLQSLINTTATIVNKRIQLINNIVSMTDEEKKKVLLDSLNI